VAPAAEVLRTAVGEVGPLVAAPMGAEVAEALVGVEALMAVEAAVEAEAPAVGAEVITDACITSKPQGFIGLRKWSSSELSKLANKPGLMCG
jgi:hypothetical protein